MILFQEGNSHEREQNSATTNKREKFRREIRKKNLNDKFGEIRERMVEEYDFNTLDAVLSSLSSKFEEEEFKEALRILKGNCESVQFNQKLAECKLGECIVNLMMSSDDIMTIEQREQMVIALNHLTYFTSKSIENLTSRDDFIDYLRVTLEKLDMSNLDNLRYFSNAVSYMMNISSELKRDFNSYLAESDVCPVINVQLAKTVEHCRNQSQVYSQYVEEAREFALMLYKNIVLAFQDGDGTVSANLIAHVLRDETNLISHKKRTFMLLSEAMVNEHFWPLLMQSRDNSKICPMICEAIDDIQKRCFLKEFLNDRENHLTKEETQNFYAVICFLNQLFAESEFFDICWTNLIENVFNGYMLGQFLIEVYERREMSHSVEAIDMYLHLAKTVDVTGEQLIIVRPADDPLELLKIFTDINLLKGQRTGRQCFEILTALLKKNAKFMPALMQFRILDALGEVLENPSENTQILIKAIQFAIVLIESEKELGEEKKLIALMENKRIVSLIEKLSEHHDRFLHVKTEIFAELLIEERKNVI